MKYYKGFEYQLARTERTKTPFRPLEDVKSTHLHLSTKGILTVYAGYTWNGFILDRPTNRRAVMFYAALCHLTREEKLDYAPTRLRDVFEATQLRDGSWPILIDLDMSYIGMTMRKRTDPSVKRKLHKS